MQNEINYLYHNENENNSDEEYDYEDNIEIENYSNKNIITYLKPDEIIKERDKVINGIENLYLEIM